jgi:hypothetical protein
MSHLTLQVETIVITTQLLEDLLTIVTEKDPGRPTVTAARRLAVTVEEASSEKALAQAMLGLSTSD